MIDHVVAKRKWDLLRPALMMSRKEFEWADVDWLEFLRGAMNDLSDFLATLTLSVPRSRDFKIIQV